MDDPNRVYMGEHGELGALDAIALHEQSLRVPPHHERSDRRIVNTQIGPS